MPQTAVDLRPVVCRQGIDTLTLTENYCVGSTRRMTWLHQAAAIKLRSRIPDE